MKSYDRSREVNDTIPLSKDHLSYDLKLICKYHFPSLIFYWTVSIITIFEGDIIHTSNLPLPPWFFVFPTIFDFMRQGKIFFWSSYQIFWCSKVWIQPDNPIWIIFVKPDCIFSLNLYPTFCSIDKTRIQWVMASEALTNVFGFTANLKYYASGVIACVKPILFYGLL